MAPNEKLAARIALAAFLVRLIGHHAAKEAGPRGTCLVQAAWYNGCMKLTAKIIALFLAAAVLLVAASGYFSMQRELAFFKDEMSRRHGELAHFFVARKINALLLRTRPDGLRYFQEHSVDGRQPVRVRWVSRDDAGPPEVRPYATTKIPGDMEAGQLRSLSVHMPDGTQRYCSYYELGSPNDGGWLIELSEAFTRHDAYTQGTILHTLYVLAALGMLAVVTVAMVGMRVVGQPLDALLAKTQRAAEGDLSGPLHLSGSDELSQLAESLNHMCDSLRTSQQQTLQEAERRTAAVEQLRHADRLKTVGRLGAGIAHELGTPLNVVAGRAALIAEGRLSDEDVKSSAETIRSEARRMTKLIEGLLNFARRKPSKREQCHVGDIIKNTIPLLDSFASKRPATITAEIPEQIHDKCAPDCGQLQQLISNLAMNAILSKEQGADVCISLDNQKASDPSSPDPLPPIETLAISVSDDGDGIPDADLGHVFEPFFTTRDTGEGTGLGLSIVHGIVADHGGWINVSSEVGAGSRFTVFLPQQT